MKLRSQISQDLPNQQEVVVVYRRAGVGLTASGYTLTASLLLLVAASTRFSLNSGYLLLFFLANILVLSACAGALLLKGVQLKAVAGPPVPAGQPITIELEVTSKTNKNGIEIWLENEGQFHALDLRCGSVFKTTLKISPRKRGVHPGPKMVIQTRQPLGLFRIYVRWHPPVEMVVYPSIEPFAPQAQSDKDADGAPDRALEITDLKGDSNPDGLRPYVAGDNQRNIAWRIFAKTDGRTLISKKGNEKQGHSDVRLYLSEALQAKDVNGDLERGLERLSAWVAREESIGRPYAVAMGSEQIGPGNGPTHYNACVLAMAKYSRHPVSSSERSCSAGQGAA